MYRSIKHLNFIRKQPCIISDQFDCQACHIRILSDGGTGLKPSDFAIPMIYQYHRLSHDMGEISFFTKFKINPYEIALFYAKQSPCNKITKHHIDYLKERISIYEGLY